MEALSRHRLGRRAPALAAFLLAMAVALPGCGSSDDSTDPATVGQGPTQRLTGDGNDTTARQGGDSASTDGKPSERRKGQGEDARAKGGNDAQSKHGRDSGDRGSGSKVRDDGSQTSSGGTGRCPSNITREQCKAYAEQPVSDTPSYTAEDPTDCAKAMGNEACEEQFEAEQSSKGEDSSVSIEHCLEEHSRAQCEAQLAPQLEAERAASEGK